MKRNYTNYTKKKVILISPKFNIIMSLAEACGYLGQTSGALINAINNGLCVNNSYYIDWEA